MGRFCGGSEEEVVSGTGRVCESVSALRGSCPSCGSRCTLALYSHLTQTLSRSDDSPYLLI